VAEIFYICEKVNESKNMEKMSRRKMLKLTATAAAGAALLGLPATGAAQENAPKSGKKMKIMVIGAHPDDPETGCGGTMALLVKEGHEVVALYLTRGEAGIEGKTHEEAAKIRVSEIENACKVTGVRPKYLTQIDGNSEINKDRYKEILAAVKEENPDVVLTHWPIDSHRDHRICSVLTYDVWRQMGHSFELYYYEVMTGVQTQNFRPDKFVNIDAVEATKEKACFCHASQGMDELYTNYHRPMEIFRGMQAGCKYAEAFITQDQSKTGIFMPK
jgi:LmbE family N-acetylglucosaminyl deacetylase